MGNGAIEGPGDRMLRGGPPSAALDGRQSPAEEIIARDPLRVYTVDELGSDGYPLEWHRLPNDHPLLDEADLVLPGGIKHVVRAFAGHRCVRCGHPYGHPHHGEWTPCDHRCEHAGPCRGDKWPRIERDDRWQPIAFSDNWPAAGDWAQRMLVQARWRILTVHHLTGDKADCRWWNLAALCQRCHLEIQGRVVMDRVWPHEHSRWFRPYVAGYYAWRFLGEDISRAEVEARMGELLALEIRQLELGAKLGSAA